MNATTIIRILPLSALIRAVSRGIAEYHGVAPTRVVACPDQVKSWIDEVFKMGGRYPSDYQGPAMIMGVELVQAHDAQPELIWSVPILEKGS